MPLYYEEEEGIIEAESLEVLEGDYVMDDEGGHFIVELIDSRNGEVTLLTQRGQHVYRAPHQLTLLDRN